MKFLPPISAATKSLPSSQKLTNCTPKTISFLTIKKVFMEEWFQTQISGFIPSCPVIAYSEVTERHRMEEVCSLYNFYSFVIGSNTIPGKLLNIIEVWKFEWDYFCKEERWYLGNTDLGDVVNDCPLFRVKYIFPSIISAISEDILHLQIRIRRICVHVLPLSF